MKNDTHLTKQWTVTFFSVMGILLEFKYICSVTSTLTRNYFKSVKCLVKEKQCKEQQIQIFENCLRNSRNFLGTFAANSVSRSSSLSLYLKFRLFFIEVNFSKLIGSMIQLSRLLALLIVGEEIPATFSDFPRSIQCQYLALVNGHSP